MQRGLVTCIAALALLVAAPCAACATACLGPFPDHATMLRALGDDARMRLAAFDPTAATARAAFTLRAVPFDGISNAGNTSRVAVFDVRRRTREGFTHAFSYLTSTRASHERVACPIAAVPVASGRLAVRAELTEVRAQTPGPVWWTVRVVHETSTRRRGVESVAWITTFAFGRWDDATQPTSVVVTVEDGLVVSDGHGTDRWVAQVDVELTDDGRLRVAHPSEDARASDPPRVVPAGDYAAEAVPCIPCIRRTGEAP